MSQEPKTSWQPSASFALIKARAQLYQAIRQFFESRGVLEVETPLLGLSNSPDIHIEPFTTTFANIKQLVLQTSPEFFMKRLLCAGSGPIYQMGKAFRNEEHGAKHNPEFTMLEWYRPGWDHMQLIEEVEALLIMVLDCPKATVITYQALFEETLGFNPHIPNSQNIQACVKNHHGPIALSDEEGLDFLYDVALDKLDQTKLWVVKDFPLHQSALAKMNHQQPYPVAERFELYYQGYELANGYHELSCAKEQKQRFESELEKRAEQNKTPLTLDKPFLQALEAGLGDCAGVAIGLDRLLMIKHQCSNINEVLSFGYTSL